ncbi:MAG: hypothetical protein CMF76_12315 [Maricaulis sp.]|uniref:Uncharacterized protein n=1 Tax=Maricaulis virginensis TaxID=144022 RepID=A0A9W6IR71_9PROT|nr:hypothetical protein [Maricaulis virginensis]MAZ92726.1 hypothetical protein [Maricaulis sp.]GLK53874.1 hypothetical protein GCM10017621_33820 [Maricaulis virginensis]|tara:strand:- start:154 stop:375 length:222 start_codon:yes stop_codon:yes gene_type:complete
MPPVTKRTLSVDLPDALVRRAARHLGPHGFSAILEQALLLWLEEREAMQAQTQAPDVSNAAYGQTGPASREIV